MKYLTVKTLSAGALIGAMLLSGCGARDPDAGSYTADISGGLSESVTASVTSGPVISSMGSARYSFHLALSDINPDTGLGEDLSIDFEGAFFENGSFEAKRITLDGNMLDDMISGSGLDIGSEKLYIGDMAYVGDIAYINAGPAFDFISGFDIDIETSHKGWIRASADDLGRFADIANITGSFGHIADNFFEIMPDILKSGSESGWITHQTVRNGDVYDISLDADRIAALADIESFSDFLRSSSDDIKSLLSLIPDLDIYLDIDGLDIDNISRDAVPDFDMHIRLTSRQDGSRSISIDAAASGGRDDPMRFELDLDLFDAGSYEIFIPDRYIDFSELADTSDCGISGPYLPI